MPPRVLHYSDLENAYDTPERVARVAGLLAARDGPDAVLAGSGDNTGPGVLSLVTDGRQSLDLFEAVDPAVETVGNHDLDNGPDALRALVADAPQQWVLANATVDGEPFGADAGIEPASTVAVGDETVGVVGVVDPATIEMTPGLDGFAFGDPVAAVDRHATRLADAGADHVIALAHVTDDDATAIADGTPVDAVLAGHSHERRAETYDGTVLTRPGASGTHVYELDLGTGAVTCHDVATVAPDEAVAAALRERVEAAGVDEVVAHVADPLSRARSAKYDGEWRLGNFVADAYRWKTGADVGLQNAGGIREGPPLEGDVTVGDLVSCSPFDEPVVVAAVTGAELRRLAHEADGRLVEGLADRWWGHVSGMQIAAPDGPAPPVRGDGGDARATDVYDVTVAGDPVDPEGAYTVAMPAYLLFTDREFPTVSERHRADETDVQYEVIVEYARECGVDAPLEGRIPAFEG